MPESLISVTGIIFISVLGAIIITVLVILFIFVKHALKTFKLKTDKFELESTTNKEMYDTALKSGQEVATLLQLEANKRETEFIYNFVNSLEDEVYTFIYSANTEIINSTDSHNTLRLLVKFLLSSTINLIIQWVSSNHVGASPQERETYLQARTHSLRAYLRTFININESVLPCGIDFEKTFNEKYKDGLFTYIYEGYSKILDVCLALKSTVYSDTSKELGMMNTVPLTMGALKAQSI